MKHEKKMDNLTELQAIKEAKKILNKKFDNWTVSYMTATDGNIFIWSYLFEWELQYETIKYENNNYKMMAIIHEK